MANAVVEDNYIINTVKVQYKLEIVSFLYKKSAQPKLRTEKRKLRLSPNKAQIEKEILIAIRVELRFYRTQIGRQV